MKLSKTAFLLLIIIASTQFVKAQSLEFFGRYNFSVGTEYHDIPFKDGEMYHSGGGGMGIEFGL